MQLDGVDGEGNSFTPLGRALLALDVSQRLQRRVKFATLLTSDEEMRARSERAVPAPVIIGGLPRTGSTFLHRLLAVGRDHTRRAPSSRARKTARDSR